MHVEILRGTTEKVQQPRKGKGEKEKRNDKEKKINKKKVLTTRNSYKKMKKIDVKI